jgi:hypothetical protein
MRCLFAPARARLMRGGLVLQFHVLLALMAGGAIACYPQRGLAGLLISLSSNVADLNHLQVGETVQFTVELAGLGIGDELVELSARAIFESAQFDTPIVSGGAILPNPLSDPLDFTVVAGPGAADATFLTLSAATTAHIVSNGTFFEFTVYSQAFGQGTFQLEFADAQQIDPADPGNLISPSITLGAPLNFTVVPEPSSVLLALAVLASFLAIGRRRLQG